MEDIVLLAVVMYLNGIWIAITAFMWKEYISYRREKRFYTLTLWDALWYLVFSLTSWYAVITTMQQLSSRWIDEHNNIFKEGKFVWFKKKGK